MTRNWWSRSVRNAATMVGLLFWSPDPIPVMSTPTMPLPDDLRVRDHTGIGRRITRTLWLTGVDCTCRPDGSFGAQPAPGPC